MLLAAIGLVAVVVGGGSGTFAGFNAQVANTGNTFATGTLFLHNQKQGSGTICKSEDDGSNDNVSCEVLFSSLNHEAGDTDTAFVKLTNAGSLNATSSALTTSCVDTGTPAIATAAAYTSSATSLTLTGLTQPLVTGTELILTNATQTLTYDSVTVSADDLNESNPVSVSGVNTGSSGNVAYVHIANTFGSGELCNVTTGVQVFVQEDTTNWAGDNGACAVPSAGSTCDFVTNDVTLGAAAAHGSYTLGSLAAGATRYYEIHVKMPSALTNTAQNSQAKFDLTWQISQ
jgi:hypothetical protein